MKTISISQNELLTGVRKAAVGVGFEYGVGEELASAAVWLAERGLDGLGCALVAMRTEEARTGAHVALSSVDLFFAEAGFAERTVFVLDNPLLFLGFLGVASQRLRRSVSVRASDGRQIVLPCGVDQILARFADKSSFMLSHCHNHAAYSDFEGLTDPPYLVRTELISEASSFAARSYVAASSSSRALGAGAGTTDND